MPAVMMDPQVGLDQTAARLIDSAAVMDFTSAFIAIVAVCVLAVGLMLEDVGLRIETGSGSIRSEGYR